MSKRWFLILIDGTGYHRKLAAELQPGAPAQLVRISHPEECRMGYANVEGKHRFPQSHSPDGGEIISLVRSTAGDLTYHD